MPSYTGGSPAPLSQLPSLESIQAPESTLDSQQESAASALEWVTESL